MPHLVQRLLPPALGRMSRPVNEYRAQRVGEHAPDVTGSTTQFRRNNNTTRVFDRGLMLGAIGDYDLVQQLGRGVFVAQRRGTKQPFAIRLLEPPGRPELLARQLVAARALASIEHPNVVRTLEVGLHEGRVYLVMEHLRGRTLASMLDLHGTPSIGQAIRVGLHVARGLEAAHQRGVIHRDLDADAVFIVPNERGRSTLKLIDFELAPGDDVVRMAKHSMSPELCRGAAVDHRSDLYSLGVLLHRVCTLELPFEGTPMEILAMYRFRSVVRPDPVLAGVPPELAATIRKCLSEDPADRYQTATEVLEALRRAADGQVRPERPEATERSERSAPMFLDMDQLPAEQSGSIGSTPAPAPAPAQISPAALAASAGSLAITSPGRLAPAARAVATPPAAAPVPISAPSAPTLFVPGPASPAAAKVPPAGGSAAMARTVVASPPAGASAAQARTVVAPPGPFRAPSPSSGPVSSGVPVPVPSLAPSAPASSGVPVPVPAPLQSFAPSAPASSGVPLAPAPSFSASAPVPSLMPGAAGPPAAAAGVPERIDPASDTSGILISSSGPARVATAVSMDPRPVRPARLLQRVPWKPVGVLAAAIVLGSVLSLWTTSGRHAPAASPAVSAAPANPAAPAAVAPAPASSAPAAPTLAAAAPAAPTLPAASQLRVQSCAPGAPALVPDVVLTVGRPEPAPAATASGAAEARAAGDDATRKPPRRKAKPRKARPAEDEPAGEQPAAADPPVSGETLVVPDEEQEPRKRTRRSRAEREDRIDL